MSDDRDAYAFSRRVAGLKSSAIRELLQVDQPPRRDLVRRRPARARALPHRAARRASRRSSSARARRREALQYGETDGVVKLRERILARAPFAPGTFGMDGVLVTQGSQQGLDLAAKLFLDPDDEVLVERPAYVGALQALRFFGARVTFLPCDAEGVDPEALRGALRRRPKLLYVTPTFQNPSGLCYSRAAAPEVREVLAAPTPLLARGRPLPRALVRRAPAAAHRRAPGSGAPRLHGQLLEDRGARAPRRVPARAARAHRPLRPREAGRRSAHQLPRPAPAGAAAGGAELRGSRRQAPRAYRARRDALDGALASRLGDRLRWQRPGGDVPLGAARRRRRRGELLQVALEEGLAFVPGGGSTRKGEGRDTLRLDFSSLERGEAARGRGAAGARAGGRER